MSEPVTELDVTAWPGLSDWLAEFPLPNGQKDTDLNMAELAMLFGVSTNAVKSWLSQIEGRMPFVEKGGPGREYKLRLSWCYAWKQQKDAQKKNRDLELMRAQGLLFGEKPEDNERGLTPKMVREVAEAKIKHAQAARMLGTLTEIEGVYQLLDQILVMFRNSSMGMSDRLERELGLTPPQARQVDRAMEEMLAALVEGVSDDVIGRSYQPNTEMSGQLVNET